MTWSDFYLVCFLVGFLLTVCSLLLGTLHLQLPHGGDGFHLHLGDLGHAGDLGGIDAGGGLDAGGDAVHVAEHAGASGAGMSPLNFGTISAFLGWFGGSGYLLTRWSRVFSVFGLAAAVAIGLVGAGIVFFFVSKLTSPEENLDPSDYRMAGMIGRVSSGIRAGGTGEIIYSQQGTRRTTGARSDDGSEIPKGTEVVVTRYEKGIAYVERWEKLAREEGLEQD